MPAAYFERQYRERIDPWEFATKPYEQERYAATLAALPEPRYRNALEIACAEGVFTALLAPRCDRLLAVDASETAVARARARCRDLPHVRFACMAIPRDDPRTATAAPFDLTMFCEVGYYLAPSELLRARDQIVGGSAPRGTIVLVHWTPPVQGHATTAADVHRAFDDAPELRRVHGRSEPTYRIDVYRRR